MLCLMTRTVITLRRSHNDDHVSHTRLQLEEVNPQCVCDSEGEKHGSEEESSSQIHVYNNQSASDVIGDVLEGRKTRNI